MLAVPFLAFNYEMKPSYISGNLNFWLFPALGEFNTSVISFATIIAIGLGAILINATVSPHIVAVMGRLRSTPPASRTKSPTSIFPFRNIADPGGTSATDITRTRPSVPRLSLIPMASERNVTVRSGPVATEDGDVGDCRGHALGMGGRLGVAWSAFIADVLNYKRGFSDGFNLSKELSQQNPKQLATKTNRCNIKEKVDKNATTFTAQNSLALLTQTWEVLVWEYSIYFSHLSHC